jgi:transposase
MTSKRRRSPRQPIDLEQLKSDPNSLLSWGIDDPVLRKLETYRLYRAGYAAADIAEAFGFARSYLYEMWAKFEAEGVESFVDKRWGAAPRKRTTEREAQIIRSKALEPERGDTDLAREFGLDRTSVYALLKEHGLQDLHRVLTDAPCEPEDEAPSTEGEKGGAPSSSASTPCC